ncbi:putative secreted protein (Por secretion system target) [Larkinella arboricola]|uniref:Putative secreted protein (Por secretion system target) n=1 Tax=Larkinella arboricola TaxID=643671 RepID=A0A327WT66_LARAB|nr:S8 family serine peptidase [Larkinella arboricola]RAJ94487.1 putative secreted protein (Por secretion system target) [Larkinella arboricola]
MKRTLLFLLLLTAGGFSTQAQNRKYLVLLKDKANSPYSVSRPEQFLSQRAILRREKQGISVQEKDLPVNPAYVSALQQAGAKIWFSSRWANAVLVESTDGNLAAIRALPFVAGIENNRSIGRARVGFAQFTANRRRDKRGQVDDPQVYGNSRDQLLQIGVDKMHAQGYRGEGMLVAILDAGFRNANQVPFLSQLFQENRVVGTYDFVKKETGVFEDDSHGQNVLSIMAGYQPDQLVGPAYKASYLLLRTEDASSETPVEEVNWLLGAEYADSSGVDVINSSLGYTSFDDPTQNHAYNDLNGQTTLISRAARWASEAGMLVVVSAGNEGNDPWHYISAPADVATILSIGAVDRDGFKAPFSSFGPTADGRIKPDLVAYGLGTTLGSSTGLITTGNGTSYSAPLVAALATGFWQANPRLTAQQVIECLRQSGSQSAKPDNELGYGIPDFERASVIAAESYSLLIYPNPFTSVDRITVQWNEIPLNQTIDATVTNSAGQVVWRQQYTSDRATRFSLQALSLSPGLYFLTLSAPSARRTVKLMKY